MVSRSSVSRRRFLTDATVASLGALAMPRMARATTPASSELTRLTAVEAVGSLVRGD